MQRLLNLLPGLFLSFFSLPTFGTTKESERYSELPEIHSKCIQKVLNSGLVSSWLSFPLRIKRKHLPMATRPYMIWPLPLCLYFEPPSLSFTMLPLATLTFFLSLKHVKHAPFPCSPFCLEPILYNSRGRPSPRSRASKVWALQNQFGKHLMLQRSHYGKIQNVDSHTFILLFSILKMNIGL